MTLHVTVPRSFVPQSLHALSPLTWLLQRTAGAITRDGGTLLDLGATDAPFVESLARRHQLVGLVAHPARMIVARMDDRALALSGVHLDRMNVPPSGLLRATDGPGAGVYLLWDLTRPGQPADPELAAALAQRLAYVGTPLFPGPFGTSLNSDLPELAPGVRGLPLPRPNRSLTRGVTLTTYRPGQPPADWLAQLDERNAAAPLIRSRLQPCSTHTCP